MADLKIDLELSPALRALDDLRRRQIPFATALALTRTAQAAQRELRSDLPHRFDIRNDYLSRGTVIQSATKATQEAAVYWRAPGGESRRSFAKLLSRQEVGGTTRPKGRHTAIPVNVKRTGGGLIPSRSKPRAILARKGGFVRPIAGGEGIFQRTSRKAKPILRYALREEPLRYAPRWDFRGTASDVARRVFAREFSAAFAKALATRRR